MTETIWGIHMKKMGKTREPIDGGFMGIGWETIGDLSDLSDNRDMIRERVAKEYPGAKPGRVRVHADILLRFRHGISIGDIVIYPDHTKPTPMINIGRVTGGYEYSSAGSPYPSRRRVEWIKRLPRTYFTQEAQAIISNRAAFFEIKHPEEFFAALKE